MVLQGGKYKVEIVYGDTKQPFLEHTSRGDGQVFVEVEPDCEFYVSIACKSEDPVVATIQIDGKDLGYGVSGLSKDSFYTPFPCGLHSRDEAGGYTKQALKFARSAVMQETEENKGIPPQFWTGNVEVSFYEGVSAHYEPSSGAAYQNTWRGDKGDVGFMEGKTNPDKKKGVMSVAGNTTEYTGPTQGAHNTLVYCKGGLLMTVHLKYCSTIGLIFAGILPKPPHWTWGRMLFPGPQNEHSDKIDSTGAIDLLNDETSSASSCHTPTATAKKAPRVVSASKSDDVTASRNTMDEMGDTESKRAKKRRKLELEKKRVEEDVSFLQSLKDDSQEDMDDYIKAKRLHRDIRNQLASLQDEDDDSDDE